MSAEDYQDAAEKLVNLGLNETQAPPPTPTPGTKRTRSVPSPVLRGHAASFPPY